jgi:hypothetical protein
VPHGPRDSDYDGHTKRRKVDGVDGGVPAYESREAHPSSRQFEPRNGDIREDRGMHTSIIFV